MRQRDLSKQWVDRKEVLKEDNFEEMETGELRKFIEREAKKLGIGIDLRPNRFNH